MLLALRAKLAEGDPAWNVTRASNTGKMIYQLWSWMIRNRSVYDFFLQLASFAQKILPKKNGMIRRLPPPMSGWTQSRDVPPVAAESFIKQWKKGYWF
jgi:L-lactate dehydrogenase complex protein LldF